MRARRFPWSACLVCVALAGCARTPSPPTFSLRPWQGRNGGEAFRLSPPAAGPEVQFPPQTVQETRLGSGVRVLLVPRHNLPVAYLGLVVRRGAADGPPGVANLVSRIMRSTPSVWRIRLDRDAILFSAKMTIEMVPQLLPALGDLLKRPDLSERSFAVERTRLLDWFAGESLLEHDTPTSLQARLLYPDGHPYRVPVEGLQSSAKAIVRQQLLEFARQHLAPDQAVVVAVGDLTLSRLAELVSDAFEAWTGKAVPRAAPPVAVQEPPATPAITLVNRPALTQSAVTIAAPGASALDGDFDALEVMNMILGGTLTSRLNSVLREDLGYTYEATSLVISQRGPGPFLLEQMVAKDATAASVRETLDQIARLRTEDVSDEELASAKARLRASQLLAYDSYDATLGELVRMAVLDLPADHAARRLARIQAVDKLAIRAVAAKYLAAKRLRIIVVGDAAVVRAPLQALALGPLEVIESKNR